MPNEFQLYFDARTSYRSLREPLIEQLNELSPSAPCFIAITDASGSTAPPSDTCLCLLRATSSSTLLPHPILPAPAFFTGCDEHLDALRHQLDADDAPAWMMTWNACRVLLLDVRRHLHRGELDAANSSLRIVFSRLVGEPSTEPAALWPAIEASLQHRAAALEGALSEHRLHCEDHYQMTVCEALVLTSTLHRRRGDTASATALLNVDDARLVPPDSWIAQADHLRTASLGFLTFDQLMGMLKSSPPCANNALPRSRFQMVCVEKVIIERVREMAKRATSAAINSADGKVLLALSSIFFQTLDVAIHGSAEEEGTEASADYIASIYMTFTAQANSICALLRACGVGGISGARRDETLTKERALRRSSRTITTSSRRGSRRSCPPSAMSAASRRRRMSRKR